MKWAWVTSFKSVGQNLFYFGRACLKKFLCCRNVEDTFVIFNNNDDSVHFLKVKSFKIANSKPFRLKFILTVFIKDL